MTPPPPSDLKISGFCYFCWSRNKSKTCSLIITETDESERQKTKGGRQRQLIGKIAATMVSARAGRRNAQPHTPEWSSRQNFLLTPPRTAAAPITANAAGSTAKWYLKHANLMLKCSNLNRIDGWRDKQTTKLADALMMFRTSVKIKKIFNIFVISEIKWLSSRAVTDCTIVKMFSFLRKNRSRKTFFQPALASIGVPHAGVVGLNGFRCRENGI